MRKEIDYKTFLDRLPTNILIAHPSEDGIWENADIDTYVPVLSKIDHEYYFYFAYNEGATVDTSKFVLVAEFYDYSDLDLLLNQIKLAFKKQLDSENYWTGEPVYISIPPEHKRTVL